jgi:hypothetical protein
MVTALWIVVFAALFFWYVAWSEKDRLHKEQQQREEAAKKTRHNLISHATPEILAYGVPDSQKVPSPEDLPAEPGPDDELIDLEKGKWSLLNAGRLLGAVLATAGSVTISLDKGGKIRLDGTKVDGVEMQPFTLADFKVTRPNPQTAIMNYSAKSGYTTMRATAVWILENGTWRTSAYQATRNW